jgi:predicted O-linked N-acetylglucosamine transferase (SPINDLY family)
MNNKSTKPNDGTKPSVIERNHEPTKLSLDDALNMALTHHQKSSLSTAEELYVAILKAYPNHIDALHLLGVVRCQQGRLDEAEELLHHVVERNPISTAYQNSWGRLMLMRGRKLEALEALNKALELSPQNAEAYYNIAEAELADKQFDLAIKHYQRGLTINPTHPSAHFGLANAIQLRDGWSAGIPHYQLAVANNPDDPKIQYHLAVALMMANHLDTALPIFVKITEKWPQHADAWCGIGNIQFRHNRLREAIHAYEKALELQPNNPAILDGVVEVRRRACDWRDDIDDLEQRLVAYVQTAMDQGLPPAMRIFTALYTPFNAEQLLAIAKANADGSKPFDRSRHYTDKVYNSDRIRIGYLIADARNHPTAHNTQLLYGLHDQDKFEVFTYSWGIDDNSKYRKRIRSESEHFIEMRGWSDEQMAQRIADDEIQILVDFMGLTGDSRMGVLARRPAPVQVNYLGFPSTTGADFMDYIVGDDVVIPLNHEPYYAEKVIRLPNSYHITSHRELDLPSPPSKEEVGIPESATFVFCCFNTPYKINTHVYSVWLDILKETTGSVLWLLKSGDLVDEHLRGYAAARGIDTNRLIFAPTMPREDHLRRFQVADLFLDTKYYGAHTTATDALGVGVPVLTVLGDTFSSRVAASLLHAVELPDCIAASWDDYRDKAVETFKKPELVAKWKKHLRDKRNQLPLFDTERLVRDLEALYTNIWEKQQSKHATTEEES